MHTRDDMILFHCLIKFSTIQPRCSLESHDSNQKGINLPAPQVKFHVFHTKQPHEIIINYKEFTYSTY